MPHEIYKMTEEVVNTINVPVGIHTHDDTGVGVANALSAVNAGAVHVQGTINGYGERTGNCNLTSAYRVSDKYLYLWSNWKQQRNVLGPLTF